MFDSTRVGRSRGSRYSEELDAVLSNNVADLCGIVTEAS
jgi:hypothetical protein